MFDLLSKEFTAFQRVSYAILNGFSIAMTGTLLKIPKSTLFFKSKFSLTGHNNNANVTFSTICTKLCILFQIFSHI